METQASLSPGKIAVTMVGLCLGLLMSALDTTIASTAMPKIVKDLSGLALYSWPFTAYLISSTAATLVFGRLSDSWGRRATFFIGLGCFMAASALCGAAPSMALFVAFRGLQGIGGGIVTSTAFSIVGEAFPPRERGKYMGVLGGMYGVAAVIGPSMGGLIADSLGWRWVFYINLPLGLASFTVLAIGLAGHRERRARASVDWAGIALFILSVVPLLTALSLGGKSFGWASLPIAGLFALALASGAALVAVERRTDPGKAILPLAFLKDREFAASALGSFFSNAVFFAGILLIPLFLQRVLRSSAAGSGLATTPYVLAYTAGSLIAGQVISRLGRYRIPAIACAAAALAATLPLCLISPSWPRSGIVAVMLALGAGLGGTTPIFQVAAQNGRDPRSIGTATASIMFFRSLGSAVGSAAYGAIMTGSLSLMLARFDWGPVPEVARSALGDPQTLMNTAAVDQVIARVPSQFKPTMEALLERLDQGLAGALSSAFWAALAFAAAALACCAAYKKGVSIRAEGRARGPDAAGPSPGGPSRGPGGTPISR
jgi:EmrB/QacA subfamily drug resistance transporter